MYLLVNMGGAGHLTRAWIGQTRTRCHSKEIRFTEPKILWNDTASLRFYLLRSKKRLS